MTHIHSTTPDDGPFGREYWEERYGAPGLAWSGNPNPVLIAEVSALLPGRALDVGSGEGGDALWLAKRGWEVTGVDIAENALRKARSWTESVDPRAAARIRWEQHDLTSWRPEPGVYDLVSSQFMHLPEPTRTRLFRSLAAAIAPGGTLLVVGHDVSGHAADEHQAHLPELMFDADDVLAAIESEGLHVEVAESRVRQAPVVAAGAPSARDVVVKATRPRVTPSPDQPE